MAVPTDISVKIFLVGGLVLITWSVPNMPDCNEDFKSVLDPASRSLQGAVSLVTLLAGCYIGTGQCSPWRARKSPMKLREAPAVIGEDWACWLCSYGLML